MIREFKEFALKGNLLELPVAFVLGVAFAAVVTSLVDDVIMQIVAAIFGKPDFSDLTFSIGDGVIRYGRFLTAVVTFLIIAWVPFQLFRRGRARPS
jgi:large conductance mechanosensitive channel